MHERGALVAELVGSRPRTPDQWDALFAGSWPAWVDADPVAAEHLPRVRAAFAHLQVALTGPGGELAGAAWGVPVAWGGDPRHLPGGYSDALARAVAGLEAGLRPDALVVAAAQVHPRWARTGTAAVLLRHLLGVGVAHGLGRAVAPLRPTGLHRHPGTPVEEYARWRREDGSAADPWLRTHERLGARVVATTPASQVFTADLARWRAWTGLALATDGEQLVDGALAPLVVDVASGRAVMTEPGIWVRHR